LAKSGISKDIAPGSIISGSPAQDHRAELKFEALLRRLPSLYKEWRALRSHLDRDPSGH
jgi:UDP-3-O-[3-hydroxymyristoyl] glucosamine N-acyltransferase